MRGRWNRIARVATPQVAILGALMLLAASEPSAALGWSSTARGGPRGASSLAERAAEAAWRRGEASASDIARAVGVALVDDGWGAGTVEARIDTLGEAVSCALDLEGLERARIDSLGWAGEIPPGWRSDQSIRIESFEESMLEIVDRQRESGYLLASIQIVDAAGDGAAVRLRARFDPGRQFWLAGPVFENAGNTRSSFLERVAGLRRGDPVRPADLERARLRLERTGLYAAIDPPVLRHVDDERVAAVFVLHPFQQNRIDGAVGYDGKRNTLSGLLALELGNLFGTGRRASASWERLDQDRSTLDLAYREPYLLGLPLACDLALAQQIEDTTWTADRARIELEGDLTGGIKARAGLSWSRTIDSGPQPSRSRQTATLLGLGYDNRGEAGTRGIRLDAGLRRGRLSRSPSLSAGEGMLSVLEGEAEAGVPLSDGWHVRLAGRGGWIEGPDSLPRPESFAVGGGESLRGYPEGLVRTLRHAVISFEIGWRQLPEGNRVYLFRDQGFLRRWPRGNDDQKGAYGLGSRIRGASGWIVLEYGVPDGASPLSGRIHFRLESRF